MSKKTTVQWEGKTQCMVVVSLISPKENTKVIKVFKSIYTNRINTDTKKSSGANLFILYCIKILPKSRSIFERSGPFWLVYS